MAAVTWKMLVLLAALFIYAMLEIRLAEAQITGCSQCAYHAICYTRYSGSNYCVCRHGYRGDGYSGVGYSGCRKRRITVWRIIVSIIGSLLGALLLLCLCLACIRNAIVRRKAARNPVVVQQGDPAYGYPQQAPYAQQGVPMASYENHNQKVPGPAGVV